MVNALRRLEDYTETSHGGDSALRRPHRQVKRQAITLPGQVLLKVILSIFLLCPLLVHAQFLTGEKVSTRSVSGQFTAVGAEQTSALAVSRRIATNADFVRLEPSLLVVSAERIREALGRELGARAGQPWHGKVYFVLHPAESTNDEATIITTAYGSGWNYRVELPDVLERGRFTRILTSVLLLEHVNRQAQPGAPVQEIPLWLAEGFAQEILAADATRVLLSSPEKIVNGVSVSRTSDRERGRDPFANARKVLHRQPALTFEQLAWPTEEQASGEDGGLYRASAQLFVSELLAVKDGPQKMLAFLAMLPRFYNWQTALFSAFHQDFSSPLAAEKWWALQVIAFMARDAGPQWSPAMSGQKLAEILSVAVELRATSNSLPTHAEVSLQSVIRNFAPDHQSAILQLRLRDLELAQSRVAPQFARLTAEYRSVLAEYLGQPLSTKRAVVQSRHRPIAPSKASVATVMKKLDDLDAQRRRIMAGVKPDVWQP